MDLGSKSRVFTLTLGQGSQLSRSFRPQGGI